MKHNEIDAARIVKPTIGVREKLGLLAALTVGAGFAAMFNTMRGARLGWARPRPAAWHSADRQARAMEKAVRKGAVVKHHAEAGAYGLAPYVGQQRYRPNYPIASARA